MSLLQAVFTISLSSFPLPLFCKSLMWLAHTNGKKQLQLKMHGAVSYEIHSGKSSRNTLENTAIFMLCFLYSIWNLIYQKQKGQVGWYYGTMGDLQRWSSFFLRLPFSQKYSRKYDADLVLIYYISMTLELEVTIQTDYDSLTLHKDSLLSQTLISLLWVHFLTRPQS